MKQIVIGLGTGRCGTKSLAYLLNIQPNAEVYHEKYEAEIGWKGSEAKIRSLLSRCKNTNKQIVGDVAFYYLPYVEYIWCQIPNVKFVCLRRDRDATIASYTLWTAGKNHWQNHDGSLWMKDEWDHCYPKYDVENKQIAIRRYYDDYYAIAEHLQKKNPDYFHVFSLDSLNSTSGQHTLLDYLGLSAQHRQLKIAVCLNYSSLSGQNSRFFLRIRGWICK